MPKTNGHRHSSAVKYASIAGAAAPYVKKIARDKQLRDDLRSLIASARHLYDGLAPEQRSGRRRHDTPEVREWIDKASAALKEVAPHGTRGKTEIQAAPEATSHAHKWGRRLFFIGAAGTVTGLLVHPRTGRRARDLAKRPFKGGEAEE
jgi:hypothetical protein